MSLNAGTVLGPYKITAPIGVGGMGEVYRAHDDRIGRDVAIKVLSNVVSNDRDRLLRFEHEAKAAGILNHPNLLSIFDVGTHEGSPYIVSELLEGETLRDRLANGPLPVRRAIDYALQIANGLAAAHEKGIVHRDLKPENIFLTKDGRAKILDFGIAKLNPEMANEGPTFRLATEPGIVLGTVGYMSPEQVRGEIVDHRSDIFSFGAILYEMLCGGRAFRRDSSVETLSAILTDEPVELASMNVAIPPALDRIVRHCLEKNREQRFQNARDLAFNLESILAVSTPPGASSSHAPMRTGATHPATSRTGAQAGASNAPTTPQNSLSTTRSAIAPRPALTPKPLPKPRKLTQLLGAILITLIVLAAGIAVGMFMSPPPKPLTVASFQRLTFRRGEVRSARFAPDGATIVYSAAWDGGPVQLFLARRETPEARPLEIENAEVVAVSSASEVALILHRDRMTNLGTLARVPLVGGTPRLVVDNVLQADWSPDGKDLAIIRRTSDGKNRIEYPIGRLLYETPHFIRDLRISPDGKRIAYIEPEGGANDISLIEPGKRPRTIARGWTRGATGLAWSADGKELWFTGTDSGSPPSLWAAPLEGADVRPVARLTGALKLQDIAKNGDLLLTNSTWRASLLCFTPTDTAERDLSWLDWSIVNDLSNDAQTILFSEAREGGGDRSSVYIRRIDGSSPVRLGDGFGDALSPDGRWVLAHSGSKLMIIPTGSGEARELKIDGAYDPGAVWLPDNTRIVIAGAAPGRPYSLHVIDTLSGTRKTISREGIWGDAMRPFCVSPDGMAVAGMDQNRHITIYPIDGGAAVPVAEAVEGEVPIAWGGPTGTSLFVYLPTEMPARVYRIDFAAHTRELYKEFNPPDRAGVYKIAPIVMTPDGGSYAYNTLRTLSDLYVAKGVQ